MVSVREGASVMGLFDSMGCAYWNDSGKRSLSFGHASRRKRFPSERRRSRPCCVLGCITRVVVVDQVLVALVGLEAGLLARARILGRALDVSSVVAHAKGIHEKFSLRLVSRPALREQGAERA